ncbi:MAG: carbon storage regulator [Gemmatimonadota bacterium]
MLILSRRVGEAVLLEGGIRIVVLGSDRKGVRLGIDAPSDVGIQREELVSPVTQENRRARAPGVSAEWLEQLKPRGEPK